MNIRTDLALRNEQRMTLAPKMLQSIEVLQLATADLIKLLDEELQRNETLELIQAEEWGAPQPPPGDRRRGDEAFGRRSRSGNGEVDAKQAMLANVPARSSSLQEHIRLQLAWEDVPGELAERVLALAERLDERGLLSEPDEELLQVVGGVMLDEALAILRALEPRGLGARTTIEAMLLQVPETDPDHDVIEALLTVHLEALSRNKIASVAKALSMSEEEIEALLSRIAELDPRPGELFSSSAASQVHPDLLVRLEDGRVEVVVDDLALPVLGIDRVYEAMARSEGTERDVRRYLKGKLRSARELISAVEQRNTTLARVGAAIISRQRDFLVHGRSAIRPMKMADIAGQLDLHTSTVSRAIAGKYMQTDLGVFSLREFFDGARGVRGGNGSNQSGRLAVQEQVRRIFAEEDPAKPLSDDDVVEQLQRRCIEVARRTVSKYRKELGIPSSWQRKRFGRRR